MEGLPYDFGIEDSDDDDIEKKAKKRAGGVAETLKQPEQKVEPEETEKPSKESLSEIFEDHETEDVAPELDAEAPLEHLSRVESEAIAQTMASERLGEIQTTDEEITSESLAAENFLENVEASGDIDLAYNQTLMELGETAIEPIPPEAEVETETAMPVDPESLVEAAKNELSPGVTYNIKNVTESAATKRSKPESKSKQSAKKSAESRSEKLYDGIVDYVVGRRFARLKAENRRHDEIEHKLSHEVSQLKNVLASRETHVRQAAQNRSFEKPSKVKTAKAENIGKVLVDREMPEHSRLSEAHKGEVAGISAHTMKHAEIVKVAEGIDVEGNTLRSIYDAHLVGEKGLRRIVAEYLRGGNYKRTLKHELLEREKDFERDPRLRDQASRQSVASSNAQLDSLLQRSGIDWSDPQPSIKEPKIKATNLPAFLEDIRAPGNPLRRVADVVMISVIMAMAAVITVLIIMK